MEGKEKILEKIWKDLGELGYMGINIPEGYGGLGMGALTLVPVLEEIGRVLMPGPYAETVSFAAPLIEKYGTKEQQEKYLPRIAEGKQKFTLALVEPGGELNPAAIQLKASAKKDTYVLEGTKILVPHADFADTMIVPVRTGGTNEKYGISLLLVDTSQAGIDINVQRSFDETRKISSVSFKEVNIPKGNLLGSENGGWDVLQVGLYHLNAALCSTMVGGMEEIVKMASEYANTREQFGQPIGRFQAIKHKIVDMNLDMESARSLSYYASWALENEVKDLVEANALARSFITEAYIKVAGDNIQIHGGMGFTWEFDCHLFLKRARYLENYLGSPEDYREKAIEELDWIGSTALT